MAAGPDPPRGAPGEEAPAPPGWARLEQAAGPAPAPEHAASSPQAPGPPHVVACNLTRRCNLECAHCYIAAGPSETAATEMDASRWRHVLGQVMEINAAPLFVLTGGEPLLRTDLEDIASWAASRGATVVVGTNATRLTDERIASLRGAGVTGVALSVDSLDETYHDRFRHGEGALSGTLAAVERLQRHEMDFIVQTTLTEFNRGEVGDLARWSASVGAVSFNLYFLVATGRGRRMRGLAPAENEAVLAELVALEREMRGRMLVRSKCQPQIMRHVHESSADSPLLAYETRCPCGVQYCRITPEGAVTPCPYIPAEAGRLTDEASFAEVWNESPLLARLRSGGLAGRCGRCEYREVCGGCRARALADTGDVLGPDDSCAYDPDGTKPVVARRSAVSYGAAAPLALHWTPEALARIRRIPSFVRGVVTSRVEAWAKERGVGVVTPELLDRVRRELPVDFSKRLPFFARDRGDSQ